MLGEIIEQDFGLDDFFEKADSLKDRYVEAGYMSSGGDFGVADLALVHEMGVKIKVTEKMRNYLAANGLHLKKSTKVITIPARAFMRNSFDLNRGDIGVYGEKLLNNYLDDKTELTDALEIWGNFYKSLMQNGVVSRELFLEENHPYTIDKKGSDTPLVNTREMINRCEVNVE